MGLPSVELPLQIANLPDPKQVLHYSDTSTVSYILIGDVLYLVMDVGLSWAHFCFIQLFHHDSDELNKALLLVFAQSLHITSEQLCSTLWICSVVSICKLGVDLGAWLDGILKELQTAHPMSLFMWVNSLLYRHFSGSNIHFRWPESSVAFFPASIRQYCRTSSTDIANSLLSKVEQEYQKLQSKRSTVTLSLGIQK